jgi:hypothetical protein
MPPFFKKELTLFFFCVIFYLTVMLTGKVALGRCAN